MEYHTNFIKCFGLISPKIIKYSYTHGQLSINQRRGIISLMPKGNKDVRYMSNWRPITLLCCDYKLIKISCCKIKKYITIPDTFMSNWLYKGAIYRRKY